MSSDLDDPGVLLGAPVSGAGQVDLGSVHQVYLDNVTGLPQWVAVQGPVGTLTGSGVSLVPLEGAWLEAGCLCVPYPARAVAGAPFHDPGDELSPAVEDELRAHYRAAGADTGTGVAPQEPPITSTDTVVRSAERLRVDIDRQEIGRARVRRYITSETVRRTVPVRYEEIVVHREAITASGQPVASSVPGEAGLSEEVHEIVLHGDHVVAEKEIVPVERITVGIRDIVDERVVTAELRTEQVEVDMSAPDTSDGGARGLSGSR